MRRERLTILSAIALSLNLLLNIPTALASVDDRFAAQVKLTEAIPGFGSAVDVDGNTAAVGASGFRFSDFPNGAVCVYAREGTTWSREQCMTDTDDVPNSDDGYAFSIALSGDTLVVGAMADITNGPVAGAAYVYVRQGHTWSLQQKLFAADPSPFAQFGISVDIVGDTIIVGDPTYDAGARFTGAVYVFERNGNGWSLKHTLTANDAQFLQVMGFNIAVSGDTVIAGTSSQFSIPAVYIFQ